MTRTSSHHTPFGPTSPATPGTLSRYDAELVRLYRENKLKPSTDLFKRAREKHAELKREERFTEYRRERYRQDLHQKVIEYWIRYSQDILKSLIHFAWIVRIYIYLKKNLTSIIDTVFPVLVALFGK